MSSFRDTSYNSNNYSEFRPEYPPSFIESIFGYHQGDFDKALDVGCGPGEATFHLARKFKNTIGTDISPGMVSQATSLKERRDVSNVSFQQSSSEDLPFIEDSSVDLVTAAECAHWFNAPKWFNEMARILKPKGTLCYFGYVDPYFVDLPLGNELYHKYVYGEDYLGPYWEEPGRSILVDLFRPIDKQIPSDLFEDVIALRGNEPGSLVLERDFQLKDYFQYLYTMSSAHKFVQQNPGKEDPIQMFRTELFERAGLEDSSVLRLKWLTTVTFLRRRSNP